MTNLIANQYVELLGGDEKAKLALLACSAALRLDDRVAQSAIGILAESNGSTNALLRRVKSLSCVWQQEDGSWYIAEDVRPHLLELLYSEVPESTLTTLRKHLAESAIRRADELSADGQITEYRDRQAKFEAAYQRILIPDQSVSGAAQLIEIWEKSSASAAKATAESVNYLADELGRSLGRLPAEVLFLQGMAARARRDKANQIKYFREVWERKRSGYIYAVAAHFFGRLIQDQDRNTAERALKDSIEWNDRPNQKAQVYHSLANLLAEDPARWSDAEEAYKQSYELRNTAADKAHVRASWANLLSQYKTPERDSKAIEFALESLKLDRKNMWTSGVCYRVLADIYERRGESLKAIEALEALIRTDRRLGNRRYEGINLARIAALRQKERGRSGDS